MKCGTKGDYQTSGTTVPQSDAAWIPTIQNFIHSMLTESEQGNGRPYFLWEDTLTWKELGGIINDPAHPQFA